MPRPAPVMNQTLLMFLVSCTNDRLTGSVGVWITGAGLLFPGGDPRWSGLERVRYGMRSREKRETHLLVVDEAVVLFPGVGYPPHLLQARKCVEGATSAKPHEEHASLTTPQITLGLNPARLRETSL
jgi:hypothetical protein